MEEAYQTLKAACPVRDRSAEAADQKRKMTKTIARRSRRGPHADENGRARALGYQTGSGPSIGLTSLQGPRGGYTLEWCILGG